MDIVKASENLIDLAPSQNPQDPVRPQGPSPKIQGPEKPSAQPTIPVVADDASIDFLVKRQQSADRNVFLQAVQNNPDQIAKVGQVARDLGVDPKLLENHPEVIKEYLNRKEYDSLNLHVSSPVTAQAFRDPNFANIASDEARNLSAYEQMYGRFMVGRLTTERDQLNAQRLEAAINKTTVDPSVMARIGEIDAELSNPRMPQDELVWYDRPLEAAIQFIGQQTKLGLPAMAAGAATGTVSAIGASLIATPAAAPAAFTKGFEFGALVTSGFQTYDLEAGNAFAQMVNMGVPEDIAAQYAPTVGGVNSLVEIGLLPLGSKAARGLVGDIGKQIIQGAVTEAVEKAAVLTEKQIVKRLVSDVVGPPIAEGAEEGIQGVVSQLATRQAQVTAGEQAGVANQLPPFDWSGPINEAMTAVVSMGIVNTPVARIRAGMAARNLRKANAAVKAVEDISNLQKDLKLPSRDLPRFLQLAMEIAKVNKAENIYLDAAKTLEVLNKLQQERAEKIAKERGVDVQTVLSSMPSVESQIQALFPHETADIEAKAKAGQDIVIPTEQFAHKVLNTDLEKALRTHIRVDPNAVSLAEAQEEVAELKKQFGPLTQKAAEKREKDAAFAKSARAVEDHFLGTLKVLQRADGTPMFSSNDAKTLAMYLRDMFSMLAVRLDMSPQDVLAKYPYQIKAESMSSERGAFEAAGLIAVLNNKTADWTSLAHETGHFYQHILFDMVRQQVAPTEVQNDVDVLLKWFGVADIKAFDALSKEEQQKKAEMFSHNYELYMAEGRAPTRGLRGLYRRFQDFFKRTYLSVKQQIEDAYKKEYGEDLPAMTGEVREVMDRMLASTVQVKLAMEVQKHMPMFQTQEESGMNDADWADYKQKQDEQMLEAIEQLDKESYLAARFTSNLKNKLLREMAEKEKEIRDQKRKEVAALLADDPWNKAVRFLRGLDVPPEWRHTQKFDLTTVEDMFKSDPKKLEKIKQALGVGASGMLSTAGIHPDQAAIMLGFDNMDGKTFVEQVASLLPFDEQVESLTDHAMKMDHSELVDPKKRDQAIDKAIHNRSEAKFVAAELKALLKSEQPLRILVAAAKAVAEERMADLPVGRISPKRYLVDSIRASRNALQALKKGDITGAIEAKRQELISQQMHSAALDAAKERDKAVEGFKRFSNPNKNVRDMDDVRIARAILGLFGIGPMATPQWDAEINFIRDNNPKLWSEKVVPLLEQFKAIKFKANFAATWKDMSLDDFRYLKVAMDSLWNKTQRGLRIDLDGSESLTADVVKMVVDSLNNQNLSGTMPTELGQMTKSERAGFNLLAYEAKSTRMEHLCRYLDDQKVGVWTKMFRTVRNALTNFNIEKTTFNQKYRDILKKYEDLFVQGTIDASELTNSKPGEGFIFGRSKRNGMTELLGALCHMGNELSYAVNLTTRKWGELVKDELGVTHVDDSRWVAFIESLIQKKVLTKRHFDFVQEVLDHLSQLKKPAQEAHHAVTGDYMDEVKSRPITNSLGTWQGGYFPAGIDHLAANIPSKPTDIETRQNYVTKMLPVVEKGWSVKRVANRKEPLLFDLQAVTEHFDDVLRYIHLQKPISDINRVLSNPEVGQKVRQWNFHAMESIFKPWLATMAYGSTTTTSGGNWRVATWLANALRANAGMAYMFWSPVQAAQNLAGALPRSELNSLGRSNLRAGFLHMLAGNRSLASQASKYMDNRAKRQIDHITDDMRAYMDRPGMWWTMQRYCRSVGTVLNRATQNFVDGMVWHAAYNKAIVDMGSSVSTAEAHAEAVKRADSFVRRTQGDVETADVANIEVGGAFYKSMMQFTSYWNNQGNYNYYELKHIINDKMGISSKAQKAFVHIALAMVVPAIVSEMLKNLFVGPPPDEDPEGHTDEMMDWLVKPTIKTALAQVPVYGQAAIAAGSFFDEKKYNDKLPIAPALEALTKGLSGTVQAGRAMVSSDVDLKSQNIRDVGLFFNMLLGIPTAFGARAASYVYDVEEGNVEPMNVFDAVRGAMTGRAWPGTKR